MSTSTRLHACDTCHTAIQPDDDNAVLTESGITCGRCVDQLVRPRPPIELSGERSKHSTKVRKDRYW